MKLSLLLNEYEELKNAKVKLVRHPLNNADVKKIYDLGFLDYYQAEQGKPVFDECDYILSFLGTSSKTAIFYGCFKVGRKHEGDEKICFMPDQFPFPEYFREGYYYELEPMIFMRDLKNRLVIDWGNSTISWHQWSKNDKEIVAIYPPKNMREVKEFKSFEDTILTYFELNTIISDPITYEDWYTALSSINGIYLILDKETGKQYIGSTYNTDGIWGRWKCYAETRDGGDVGIKKVLEDRKEAYKGFQFTILRVLPKTITDQEAIEIESLYKDKFGTRTWGMNLN